MGLILLIVLIVLLLGGLPTWPDSRNWGYGPSGGLGLLLVIVLILLSWGTSPVASDGSNVPGRGRSHTDSELSAHTSHPSFQAGGMSCIGIRSQPIGSISRARWKRVGQADRRRSDDGRRQAGPARRPAPATLWLRERPGGARTQRVLKRAEAVNFPRSLGTAVPNRKELCRARVMETPGMVSETFTRFVANPVELSFRTSALDYPRISSGAKLRRGGRDPGASTSVLRGLARSWWQTA